MRTIAPSGFLHSFEFNEIRATTAQEEFENNGLGEKRRLALYFFFVVCLTVCQECQGSCMLYD